MKIVILSRRKNIYSNEVQVVDTLRCYMNIASSHSSIHYRGHKLNEIDAIIPRIGASITFYGAAVTRQFEMQKVFCLNSSVAINRSRDKLRSLQLLARKGLGLPITGFANSPDDIDDLIEMVGKAPLVIKLLEGTQGIGVVLAETSKSAKSVIEAFLGLNVNIMVQEYIQEARGADIRCFVIGDEVVAAIKRQAKPGEFRSNLHRGGSATQIRISKKEEKIALRAAKIMGLHIAGVDMLRSDRGPLIMEVNSSPGLKGIETATGIDIAEKIMLFIEKNITSTGQRDDDSKL
jgi:ribosomal protein S6--L-glutamate ligase